MPDATTLTANLNCTLTDLTLRGWKPGAEVALDRPFTLEVTITFSNGVDGELARLLMSLGLTLRVSFYARPYGPMPEINLGSVSLLTQPDTLTYHPSLTIADPAAIGLNPHASYQMGAIVRVGHSPFCIPSLLRGYLEGLTIGPGGGRQETLSAKPRQLAREVEPLKAVEMEEVIEEEDSRDPEVVITKLKIARRKSPKANKDLDR